MEFLADFLVESIIQELVSEAWEEELWDLEENHLSQVPDFWERLEQVLEDLQVLAPGQVPSQGQVLWCPGEQQGLRQLIKRLPKLGLGLVALAEFQGVLELAEFQVVLALVEFLGLELVEFLVVLVASVA